VLTFEKENVGGIFNGYIIYISEGVIMACIKPLSKIEYKINQPKSICHSKLSPIEGHPFLFGYTI